MPTTAKGIRYPSGTDPVDIPTDLGNLASDVDALIGTTALTTKGDLLSFSTVEARLPVGSDGQYLTALASATTGLAWQTLTSTNKMALLASETKTTWTDATFTFSSIPATYTDLIIQAQVNIRPTTLGTGTINGKLTMTVNGSAVTFYGVGGTVTASSTSSYRERVPAVGMTGVYERDGSRSSSTSFDIMIPNYAATTFHKIISAKSTSRNSTNSSAQGSGLFVGGVDATTAISSIVFGLTSTGTAPTYWGIGSNIKIWGIKRFGL